MLKREGDVQAEGGPLLIADSAVARGWRGVVNGGEDYDEVCRRFDADATLEGVIVPIRDDAALVWEMEGAGTAYVYSMSGGVLVVRAWIDPSQPSGAVDRLAALPLTSPTAIGAIQIASGALTVMWAAEDGSVLPSGVILSVAQPVDDLSLDGDTLILPLANGVYVTSHDAVVSADGKARRCHLVALST